MVNDHWLPTSRHIKDLINHAEKVLEQRTNSSNGISLVLLDNATELLLREYQRFYLKRSDTKVSSFSFKQLIDNSNQLTIIKNNSPFFVFTHDVRNSIYHTGHANPAKRDVKSALTFTVKLFNEIHPEHRFREEKTILPTKRTIESLNPRPLDSFSEVYFATIFSDHYTKQGYKATLQKRIEKTYVSDMTLEKENEFIILEFKSDKNVFLKDLAYYSDALHQFQITHPELNVKFWLIMRGRIPSHLVSKGEKIGITIIDDNNITKFVSGRIRCARCGTTESLQVNHIIPLAKGGKNTTDNLQFLCANCHTRKSVGF